MVLWACHARPPAPRLAPAIALQSAGTSTRATELPRYFPRGPAKLTVVATTEQGVMATHGAMRILLRDNGALPDSAPYLVAASTTGSESGGTPTTSPAGATLEVPERLGGGWLFVVGREVWSTPGWLQRPKRLFEFSATPRVYVGMATLVAQEPWRPPVAFRPDGQVVPLTGWPESPAIADLAARDATHAAVVADLRGLAVTEDGGTTWREIPSTRTPIGVRVAAGGYLVHGRNGGDERETSWRIDVHGDVRGELAAPSSHDERSAPLPLEAWERVVAHGVVDAGRYLTLDHGLFESYRIDDGARLTHERRGDPEMACQPVHWPGGGPGFACTGASETSLWRVRGSQLEQVASYPGPRPVWSTARGALALGGACEPGPALPGTTALCVWGQSAPATLRLQGAAPDDRVAPQPDGSVVVLRPPSGPRNSRRPAEMFVDRPAGAATPARVHGVPLMPEGVAADVREHLSQGHWLRDLFTLPGGELGAWIERDGRLVGVRIHPDGRLEAGPRSGAASSHRTAGMHSLSWSTSGAAFESTDGGMHYTQIGLPAVTMPKTETKSAAEAGCSEIGCILPTVLRIGWGAEMARAEQPARAQPSPAAPRSPARLVLDCSLVARSRDSGAPSRPPRLLRAPPMRGAPGSYGATTSFFGGAVPVTRDGQILQGWDSVDLADHRSATFDGRAYAWGAFSIGSTDPDAGWQWRWYDPRGRVVHSTAIARPPEALALSPLHPGTIGHNSWSIVPSTDDPRRAVGIVGDSARTLVYALAAGDAPTPIELDDGASFGTLDSAWVGAGDRTLLAGAVGDPAGSVIYLARGQRAERIGWVPRVGTQGKPSHALIAVHSDGIRIAIAVEDHDAPSRSDAAFTLREIYPSEGTLRRVGIGPAPLRICDQPAPGFEVWTKIDLPTEVELGNGHRGRLQNPTRARLRFGDEGAVCVTELTSDVDYTTAGLLDKASPRAGAGSAPLLVGHAGTARYTLGCR